MYSDKIEIQQLVSLLDAHQINHIVLCPGSRNAPIVHTFANHPAFTCYSVTDERSAGFFALGIIQAISAPVAVCCTSGTALLNLFPAVAEAYYQQLPLLVLSADRPSAWIGQMAGQTIPQPNVFGRLVRHSVNLPEVKTSVDEWHANRLINEAILSLTHHGRGPAHINIPISEPLFNFVPTPPTPARVIQRQWRQPLSPSAREEVMRRVNQFGKRMIVIGQMATDSLVTKQIREGFVCIGEHLSNQRAALSTHNFDTLLSTLTEEEQEEYRPDLLITVGGHIVSKRLKAFLRAHPPREQWHISEDGTVVDLYCSLTQIIETAPKEIFSLLHQSSIEPRKDYVELWKAGCRKLPTPLFSYSGMYAIGAVMKRIPTAATVLHLGNSSVVRQAEFYSLPEEVTVYCNRGTNGIEGSLSTAVGYAALSDKLNIVILGDLSFFYDMNALWNRHIGSNLRVLLINNSGGGIFHSLPRLQMTPASKKFITSSHHTIARGWVEERGFKYLEAREKSDLDEMIPQLLQTDGVEKPILLEVVTDAKEDARLLQEFYSKAKQIRIETNNK